MKDNKLWNFLNKKITNIEPIGGKLKFVIDQQSILIDGSGNHNIISLSDEEADCTVTTSLSTLEKIQKKELNPMTAMVTKKIKIKGKITLAMKLKSLFSL